MACVIDNIAATSAAQTAQTPKIPETANAHVATLLATRQVQPGDKLPLDETVKEMDVTIPIRLVPTGKNIFVRLRLISWLPFQLQIDQSPSPSASPSFFLPPQHF